MLPNQQKNKSILREGIDDSQGIKYWFTMPDDKDDLLKAGLSPLAEVKAEDKLSY